MHGFHRVAACLALGWPAIAPAEAQEVYRHGEVRLSTGVRLHYVEQGDPAAPALILLHGLTDSWFSFSRVLPELSSRYRVYALDLRGHGDSERPELGYAMHDLAADVIGFMDAMSLSRATLVGHSMGSFVAQQAALAAPERVAGLVLIGSAADPRNDVLLELQRAMSGLSDPVPADFAWEFQASTVHRPLPEEFMSEAVSVSLKAPARVWRSAMNGLLATSPLRGLPDTGTPTLIIWGDRDAVFSRGDQEALTAAIPHATFKVYVETGHATHWERPREVARDLEAFVRAGSREG